MAIASIKNVKIAGMAACVPERVEENRDYTLLPPEEIEKYIARTDKRRADYYKYHTGREWTDARNYDLCLDSSKLGFERCVEEIKAYMKVRFGE